LLRCLVVYDRRCRRLPVDSGADSSACERYKEISLYLDRSTELGVSVIVGHRSFDGTRFAVTILECLACVQHSSER